MSKFIGELKYILNSDKTASVTFSTDRGGDLDNYPNLIDKDIIILATIEDTFQSPSIFYDVTSIGDSAFENSKIKSIVIPASVTSIGDSAFYYTNIKSIVIPESVTSIGDSAFEDSKIKSIVIPASVTSIGDYAFENSSLKSIVFEGSKPNFGTKVFNEIGNTFNPSFGYIDEKDNSWKGTNYIDNLIIRNTSYYSKSIISIIICLIFLFMLCISKISVGYKYSLYIIIIISSLVLNALFNMNMNDKLDSVMFKIISLSLSFLLFFIALIPMYSLLKLLLFGLCGLIFFLFVFMLLFSR